jgi:NhaP-type Na+/H+ or K+/H+ antiporter
VVWAGARGAVTLAAAQTLPESTPHRSLLVFVAFVVAAGSLLVQGGTLTLLVRWVKPTRADAGDTAEERDRLVGRLLAANREVLDRHADDPEMRAFRERLQQVERVEPDPRAAERVGVRLEMVEAQPAVLLAAREEGPFSSQLLTSLLDTLDAEQISIEMRAEGAEPR